MKRLAAALAFGCALGCAGSQPAPARLAASATEPTAALAVAADAPADAVGCCSDGAIRVLLESDFVRVLELRLAPGQRAEAQAHPATASYCFGDGRVRILPREGAEQVLELHTGAVVLRPPSAGQSVENIGELEVHAVVVERTADPPPFQGEYLDAPMLAPQEYRVLAENDAFRVIEIRRAPGNESVAHSHRAGVAYALESAHVSSAVPGQAPVERILDAGAVAPVPVTARHTERNVGTTPVHVVLFELK